MIAPGEEEPVQALRDALEDLPATNPSELRSLEDPAVVAPEDEWAIPIKKSKKKKGKKSSGLATPAEEIPVVEIVPEPSDEAELLDREGQEIPTGAVHDIAMDESNPTDTRALELGQAPNDPSLDIQTPSLEIGEDQSKDSHRDDATSGIGAAGAHLLSDDNTSREVTMDEPSAASIDKAMAAEEPTEADWSCPIKSEKKKKKGFFGLKKDKEKERSDGKLKEKDTKRALQIVSNFETQE